MFSVKQRALKPKPILWIGKYNADISLPYKDDTANVLAYISPVFTLFLAQFWFPQTPQTNFWLIAVKNSNTHFAVWRWTGNKQ